MSYEETLKFEDTNFGDEIANEIIERSKDTSIIYMTEDTIFNSQNVIELAAYIEQLQKENKQLKEQKI